jgi:HEAT repeat protein
MTQILDFKTQRPWDRLTHEVLEKLDIKIATIRRLARSLLAPQRDERHAARTELSSFAQHPVARDEFVRATKSSWAEVRDWAVTMLIQQRDARVVPALIDKLREPYSWNRKATISDLESVVDESSGPQLLALLASEDGRLADLAVHLLGRVGRSVAPRLLTTWRSNAPLKDRAAALRALGAVGARKLRDEASRLLIYSRKVELRMAAAEYLGRIADIKDAPTLMKVLKSKSASESVRGTAAVAIARMKHKAAIPVIVKLFHKRVAWTDMAEALLRFDTDETRSVVGEERTRATNIIEAGPDDKATELALSSISRLYEEIENRAAR